MRKFLVSTLLAGAAFAALPASAATFFEGNTGLVDNKVKAFSDGGHPATGSSVFGITTDENELVKFTGDVTLGITGGSGYAQIHDGAGAQDWKTLTIALDSYAFGFSGIEFSVQFNNSDVGNNDLGTLGVTANFLNGVPSEFFSVSDFKNPANRSFYLLAGAGQVLSSIVLTASPKRFDQVKQVDIELAAAPPPPAVPEPATWAMMIGGLGLVGATMRRRATKIQFA